MNKIPYFLKLCVLLKLSLAACLVDEGRENNQVYDYIVGSPDSTHLMWAQNALSAWNIGLQNTNNTSTLRNVTPGYINNPPHWITVANDECETGGLPNYVEERCFETSSAVGVCYSRTNREGNILETTIVVKESHLSGTVHHTEKQATFTHEVGHCLAYSIGAITRRQTQVLNRVPQEIMNCIYVFYYSRS